MKDDIAAHRFEVSGIVQGVGFRPFVYQLAAKYDLKGDVSNTAEGVTIHLEGSPEGIDAFHGDLKKIPPPLSYITKILIRPVAKKNAATFTIAKSRGADHKSTLISPDMVVCDDCLRELFNPLDRRFRYPFINCTNCGPRYTIIDDIPYDRPNTSMKVFDMCPSCRAEYDDPLNRRFHAQPNACPVCGPQVSLFDNKKQPIDVKDPIGEAAELLRKGYIVAVKGLGGFHLAVDAENEGAVMRLRKRKQREEKPLAVMAADLDRIRQFAHVDSHETTLLTSRQRPIVILHKKQPTTIALSVASKNRYFGVMMPYTPLHYLLLDHDFLALVMTSGNLSEDPIAIDNEDAFHRLSRIADYLLIHDRDIYLRADDSIIKWAAGDVRYIRRSRGIVPTPVFLKQKAPAILACGAEQKNTICLTRENQAFLSQHIGDLENHATYEFFKRTIDHLKQLLDIDPVIVAHDLHPDYLSTQFAHAYKGVEKIGIQHHHAHIAGCMAENKIEGPVIGLSFDGTGYGTDGHIWGGEILVAEPDHFDRVGHLAYIPMPGSAAAIKQPWRMGISYLYDAFGEDIQHLDLPLLKEIDETKIKTILAMINKKINSPLTSSLGRFFDGIAAILGIRNQVAFEGQAAMELEMMAMSAIGKPYDFTIESRETYEIPLAPLIRQVVYDLTTGVTPVEISVRFHATLIELFLEHCRIIRKNTGLDRVVLSGGVFQNSILFQGMVRTLSTENFKVYTHIITPCNDGGISLGQALVAASRLTS